MLLVWIALNAGATACPDVPPDTKYSCKQQKSWGKCSDSWMQGFCCETCFQCKGALCGPPTPAPAPGPPSQPCDRQATTEVREVLKIIQKVQASGRMITGQVESDEHDDAAGGSKTFISRDWDAVFNITGKHPGLWGSQFLWGTPEWTKPYRQAMVDNAIQLWKDAGKQGRVLTHINFHLCPPTAKYEKRSCTWHDIEGSHLNPASLGTAILTNGTVENRIWVQELDTMASYLLQLQAANVPILWRPFHEENGAWFWWGQQPRFKELWAQMFDRLVAHHGLHNLLWVYGPSGQSPIGPYYPGADMVDLLGQDTYAKADDASASGFTAAAYGDLVSTAAGKPVALTEIGLAPGPAVLAAQNHSYSLMWGGYEKTGNTAEGLRAFYNSPRTVNRGDPVLQ